MEQQILIDFVGFFVCFPEPIGKETEDPLESTGKATGTPTGILQEESWNWVRPQNFD